MKRIKRTGRGLEIDVEGDGIFDIDIEPFPLIALDEIRKYRKRRAGL